MRAVVLLSGGLDSYTAAAMARADGFALCALTIHYGQRHVREIAAARRVADALGVEARLELNLDLRGIGGSALTAGADVPHGRDLAAAGIPVTYVPARNTIFLSLALAWAEVLGLEELKTLMGETLGEEETTDARLSEIAEGLNVEAVSEEMDEDEEQVDEARPIGRPRRAGSRQGRPAPAVRERSTRPRAG